MPDTPPKPSSSDPEPRDDYHHAQGTNARRAADGHPHRRRRRHIHLRHRGGRRRAAAAAPRWHRMRRCDVGAGARAPRPEHHRVVAPDVPGLGESAPGARSRRRHLRRLAHRSCIDHTGLGRPTVVAHSLVGSLTARVAAAAALPSDDSIISAAPGVGPYRMPLRLRYVAIRFAIHPTAQRGALRPLRPARPRCQRSARHGLVRGVRAVHPLVPASPT